MVLTQVLKSVVDVPTFDIDRPQFDAWWTGEFAGATLAFDFTTGRAMINNSSSTIDQLLTGTYTLDSDGLDVTSLIEVTDLTWLTQGVGTLYVETAFTLVDTNARATFAFSTTTPDTTYIRGYFRGSSTSQGYQVVDDNVQQASLTTTLAYPGNGIQKLAYGWAVNNMNQCANGILDTADTSGTPPTNIDQFFIASGANLSVLNGKVRKLAYWPIRRPDAELQSITA